MGLLQLRGALVGVPPRERLAIVHLVAAKSLGPDSCVRARCIIM